MNQFFKTWAYHALHFWFGYRAPRQMALAIALGIFFALTPDWTLQSAFIFLLAICLRVQFSLFLITTLLFIPVYWLLESAFDEFGRVVLYYPLLRPYFNKAFDSPVIPFTWFNYSIVMGSALFCTLILIPIYKIASLIFTRKQVELENWLTGTRGYLYLRKSILYRIYDEEKHLRESI